MYRIMKNCKWFYIEKQKNIIWIKYWKVIWYEEDNYDTLGDTRYSEFYIRYFETEELAKRYIDEIDKPTWNEFICYYH